MNKLLNDFAKYLQKQKNKGLDFDCVEREVDTFLNDKNNITKNQTMNTQLINQIKELPGVKEVTLVNDVAVVVFEPRKPILHDEYGVPLFDNDEICYVNTNKTCFTVEYHSRNLAIGDYYPSHVKLFSTPESAQKWIDEHKKTQLIYTDPEDGTEFFDGDEFWYFSKDTCEVISAIISDKTRACEGIDDSKIYKSHQLCELALAKFIQDKYK